ncbi:Uncharacterised protein [Bordetella pertussis]|nr:Uncharacterised protein [Bordetella pertussis]
MVSLPGKALRKCERGMPARSTQVCSTARSSWRTSSTWARRVSASFSTILAVKRMPMSSVWMMSWALR